MIYLLLIRLPNAFSSDFSIYLYFTYNWIKEICTCILKKKWKRL